jgi:hypothetical protein
MVRIISTKIVGDGINYIEVAGLSTDTKPAEKVATGSVYLEVDTGKAYFYNETAEEWTEIGGSDE